MTINIPKADTKRIVIVGGGFGGIALARKICKEDFQVVLIDKNNYHQFQPLFYQVAMAGLEPSAISFPFRKLFQKKQNVFIRVAELLKINSEKQYIETSLGNLDYDHLVISTGVRTNYFGNDKISKNAIPMKSVSDSLYLRNKILTDYEQALITEDYEERQGLIDIVIVGGGPTGVEVAGALAEMKKYILPKDYFELDSKEVDIYLVQGADMLLKGMSDHASKKAEEYLKNLGVQVSLNTRVTDYDGKFVYMMDGTTIRTNKVIWAAGVKGLKIEGIGDDKYDKANRILVDGYCKVQDHQNIFAIGDAATMISEAYPWGHPQVAQVALQQGKHLAEYFIRGKNKINAFEYKDLGSMATVGRNRAVVDFSKMKFGGRMAWYIWLFVHLFAILGVKNKIVIFLNWLWNYFTYDQSLRLIIKPSKRPYENNETVNP